MWRDGRSIALTGALAVASFAPAAWAQLLLDDPLNGSTTGTRSGGSFVNGCMTGWRVDNQYDSIFWHVPTVSHGAFEYRVCGLSTACVGGLGGKNELSHMYDYTYNNADFQYSPGYREDPFKQYIRKQCEAGKENKLELLWAIDPNFFEDDTPALSWDANTIYTFRDEWENAGGNSTLKTYRNGALIWTQTVPGSWNPAGFSVRIGASTRRADEGANIGAVYSNVKVYNLGGGPPGAPTITAPNNAETVNTTVVYVQWNGDSHTQYQLRVNTANNPDTGITYDSQLVASDLNYAWTGTLSNNTTYYVFVRLVNSSGVGPWSATGRTFTVNTGFVPSGANMVRVNGTTLRDNNGPFLGLGASYMRALQRCKYDRTRFQSDCALLASKGFNYIRALSMVPWEGLEIAPVSFTNPSGTFIPAWSDYDQQLKDMIDIAYGYGLRTEITIFAGAADYVMPPNSPSNSTRTAHQDRILADIAGREHKVVQIEVANEYWQNGFPDPGGVADVRARGQYLADRTSVPVSLSSPSDTSNNGIINMYAGSAADIATVHFSRDIGTSEGGWFPVRDCYRTAHLPGVPPVSSNEPIGAGSSVSTENDPLKLCAAAVFAYIANLPMYVYHSRAGVFGWTGCCPPSGTEVPFENTAGINAYQFVRTILPPEVSSWVRNDGLETAAPFTVFSNGQANKYWPDVPGATSGCDRNIGTIKGSEFICFPMGILGGGVTLQARRPVAFTAYNPLTGAVAYNLAKNTGDQFTLATGPGAYIIKGTFTDINCPTTEVAVDLGSPDVAAGMTHPQNVDGNTVPVSIGGRSCRQNTNANVDHFFYFGACDSFAFAGSKPNVFIFADYYDAGTGSLTLEYDGASGAYQNGGSVALTNTNTWKQKVWHLTDAYFANRQNAGADLRISNGGVTTLLEPFSYANGDLNGKVSSFGTSWSGGTVGNIEVSSNQLKVISSTGPEAATNFFATLDFPAISPGGDNILVVKAQVSGTNINNGNTWKLHFQSVNGQTATLMAEWDGHWDGARPRHELATGGQFGDMGAIGIMSNLTSGGVFDEIRAHINTSTGQAQYFFNNNLLGTITDTGIVGKTINRIIVQRQARPSSDAPGMIFFDNLSVAPTGQPAIPLTFYLDLVRVTTDAPLPPIITAVTPNPETIFNGVPYSRQLTLVQGSPAPSWSVLQGPAGLTVNSSGQVSGWTPGAGVFGNVTIQIQASNTEGSDDEMWVAKVVSKADFDQDGDADLIDFALMQRCFSGDAIPYATGCGASDLDGDGDVDALDFGVMLPCLSGADTPPGC